MKRRVNASRVNAPKKALAELKSLTKAAKNNLYRRVELAAQILADLDWIAREHAGSEIKAHDALQSEFFPDLGGYLSLGKLIQMYHRIGRDRWEEVRYDVAAVEVMYDDQRTETATDEKGRRTSWKTIAMERAEDIEQLNVRVLQLARENAELRRQNAELRQENTELQAKVTRIQFVGA